LDIDKSYRPFVARLEKGVSDHVPFVVATTNSFHEFVGPVLPILRGNCSISILGEENCCPYEINFFGDIAECGDDRVARIVILKPKYHFDGFAELVFKLRERTEVRANTLVGFR